MPRYYMHLDNDLGETPDHEGVELSDLATARIRGRTIMRELIAEDIRAGRNDVHLALRIQDDSGAVLHRVEASASVIGLRA